MRLSAEAGKTVILITNDVDEALIMADRIIPLKPGPGAGFGPNFSVDLPRPRDRAAINHNAGFKRLRGEITRYLMRVGIDAATDAPRAVIQLPDLKPLDRSRPPRPSPAGDTPPAALRPFLKNPGESKYLEFFKVTKVYPTPKGPLTVVDEFNLNIKKGEFVSIIGHSGCGKSTVLSMTAGLNDISDGGIVLDRREVAGAGPDRAVVFQAPSLFPWLSAFENVALGVDRVFPHASEKERREVVEYYLDRVGLGGALHKKARDHLQWHEAAGRHRPRLCPVAQITAAGRALRHAGFADALGTAGIADGSLDSNPGHGHGGDA